jgi:S1-C subfamily serine protease
VISGADKVTVTFSDGTILDGKVVGADPDSDLAVVNVQAKPELLSPVQMADSNQVKVGEIAIAIGNPFGLQGTMTVGIVSALGRSLPAGTESSTSGSTKNFTIPNIIQTDAPINPGNSGGVLVNDLGQVIGVTSAIESPVRGNAGIGFAIPSSIVQKIVPELVKDGKVEHPWIGIMGTTLTPDIAKAMNVASDQRGILVIEVTSGSPADKAGLKGSSKVVTIDGSDANVGGDIITAINGQPTKDFDTLVAFLSTSTSVNDIVKLTILRDNEQETLNLTLTARPARVENTQAKQPQSASGKARLGITVTDLTSDIANAMNLAKDTKGVLIVKILTGSPAEKAGLHGSDKSLAINGNEIMVGGDIITKLNQKAIATVEDLLSEIGKYNAGDEVTLTLLRDGKEMDAKVALY